MATNKIHDRLAADLPIGSVVTPTVVDDPLEPGASVRVLLSTRDDPFAAMYSRGHIDQVQFAAGRRWQFLHEQAEIGGMRAIDPTQLAVDGGRFKEPDVTRMSFALHELHHASTVLQAYRTSLVYDVLVRNRTMTQIAAARSITSGRQIGSLMSHFREALDALSEIFGLAMQRR